MKKLFAGILAAAMVLSLNVTAFAASSTRNMIELTGEVISENGVQYKAGDSVTPNQTVYYLIPPEAAKVLNNSKNVKVSTKKVKNSKLIKSIKLVEKKLVSSGTASATVPTQYIDNVDGKTKKGVSSISLINRNTYVAVELADTTGLDEYKVEFSVSFTPKAEVADFLYGTGSTIVTAAAGTPGTHNNVGFMKGNLLAGERLTLDCGMYVANTQGSGDTSITVGTKGVTVKPVGGDDNEVIFENADGDQMALLSFRANSNPDKFYAKLSTKWTSELLSKFKNTDAVIRNFSAATIDASSRATLALNNPFDETVKTSRVYIYSVSSKGVLTDVTSTFTYNSDDDTFDTRTRTLGTYVISDVKVK